MSAPACKSTCRGVPCLLPNGHADQHRNGIHRWIVSDATIAEAEAMAQSDREAAHRYTVEESVRDAAEWRAATDAQRSDAFSSLLALVRADARGGDAYCAQLLRDLRAERDGATS